MKLLTAKLSKLEARVVRGAVFAGVALVLGSSSVVLALTLPQAPSRAPLVNIGASGVHAEYSKLLEEAKNFSDRQAKAEVQVASREQLDQLVNQVRLNIDLGQFRQARASMRSAHAMLATWGHKVDQEVADSKGQTLSIGPVGPAVPTGVFLPIVMYHYTPPDFEEQLEHLEHAGYTVVDMDQALSGLHGAGLPAKPVVLTFDDGFANQMDAFEILKRHNMKATFYIINGGVASRWCIGANRRYNDPLQPPEGCGDAYLNWDQIRTLDRSGLITIGGHTIDHESLAGLPYEEQRHEVVDSKVEIEQQLGHSIRDFAYPSGSYGEVTTQIAREAGYLTAVTTNWGTYQEPGAFYTLKRVREAYSLP
jgi:peptidoglycan/xylan/chitin deacetylase (PgdA/CDA1 family)